MKILITGAFGNLGQMCINTALEKGYQVRCFDLENQRNHAMKRKYSERCEVILGDIRNANIYPELLQNVDAVIHNASLLPPASESKPELAEAINVEATRALIQNMEACDRPPRLVFPSSVTVFGRSSPDEGVKNLSDHVSPTDNYTRHKLTIEKMLQTSSLSWVILRVGVAVDSRTLKADRPTIRKLLKIHPESPLEFVHPKDVATAMCNATISVKADRKILLIGGGEPCQINHYRFLNTVFRALSLTLPYSTAAHESYYTHWMDSTEAQELLDFQHHTFDDYEREISNKMRLLRICLWPIRPILNRLLPYALAKL